MIELVPKVEEVIWALFDTSKYKNVKRYIQKWHEEDGYNWENFTIYYKEENIDLSETLYSMSNDLLIKIAIDVGVDTPGFLPIIPTFKNLLKESNENAFKSFDRAIKNVYDNPDESVLLANSTLESLIKGILSDKVFEEVQYNKKATLYDLTQTVLKQFNMFPSKKEEIGEIEKIGSSLLNICKYIEELRSSKTKSHGKLKEDFLISDPLWASFIINSAATVGLFMIQFFTQKYKPFVEAKESDISDIPF